MFFSRCFSVGVGMKNKLRNTMKIVEVCKVSPLLSSQNPSKFSLPLTDFDWIFMNFPPRQRLLFYPITNSNSFFNSILPNLKHSLSLTLQHFLPLAGNLVWPEDSPLPFILYAPNDAVSFTVAETDSDFDDHVASHAVHEIKHSRSLVPNLRLSSSHSSFSSSIPMLAIQLTLFRHHRGFSIGFSSHHVLFDGVSFNLFLKSWAHICSNSNHRTNQLLVEQLILPPQLTPSFERLVLESPSDNFVPKNRSLDYDSSDLPPSDSLRATFELSPTHIHKLKKRVTNSLSEEELHLSTYVVAYAYVLECLIKAKKEEGAKEYIYVAVTADVRGICDPPLSSNYFGNCVTGLGTIVEARELLRENGFRNVAKRISNLIMELRKTGSFKVYKPSDVEQLRSEDFLGRIEVVTVAESPKFKVYETDFGWGKPKKFEMVSLVNNNFSLTDNRDGNGGVEVGLILPKHQMDNFVSLFGQGLT